MRRRELLTGIGTVATATVAGCSGGDGAGGGDDTPEGTDTSTPAGEPTTTETDPSTPDDDVGRTLTAEGGLSLTLSAAVLTDTVVSGETVAGAAEGEQYLLARLTAERDGSERWEPPGRDAVSAGAGGETYEAVDLSEEYGIGPYRQPVDGPAYDPPRSVSGDQTADGWVVVTVPATAEEVTLRLADLSTADGNPVEWLVRPTEGRLVTFETAVDRSGEIVQQQDVSYTVSVTNTGGREGRFHQEFVLRGHSVTREDIATTLGPGESAEQTVSTTVESDRAFTATLGDRTITDTTVAPPTFAVGETWTASDGLAVTVSDVQVADSVTYGTDDGERTATPPSGKQFLLFSVEAVNDGQDENMRLPDAFAVETPETTVRDSYDLDGRDRQLQSPVTGGLYEPSTLAAYGPGQGEQGWLVFAIDAAASLEDVTVRTRHSVGLTEPDDIAGWRRSA